MMAISPRLSPWFPLGMGLLALVGGGCVSLDPQPFRDFSASVTELQEATDEALANVQRQNRSRFIAETARVIATAEKDSSGAVIGDEVQAALAALRFEPGDPPPFTLDYEENSYFLSFPRWREAVGALNSALVDYADLLADMIAASSFSVEEFRERAQELNENLRDVSGAVGLQDSEVPVAFISELAANTFELFLSKRNTKNLKDALEVNRRNIEELAPAMASAMITAGFLLWQYYDDANLELTEALATQVGGNEGYISSDVADHVELNEDLELGLKTLDTLARSYRDLPRVHEELIRAVDDPGRTLSTLEELSDRATLLKELFSELSEP